VAAGAVSELERDLTRRSSAPGRVRALADAFGEDQCGFLAGGVAYQFFFAIVPLLALAIGILGFVYGSERAIVEFSKLLGTFYPSASGNEARIIRQLAEGRALSLGLGLLGTVVSITAIHGALDASLASVLGSKGARSFMRGKLEALAFVGGLLLLATLSFAITYGAEALQEPLAAAGLERGTRMVLQFLAPLFGALPAFAFFYLVYRVVPRTAVGSDAARAGAIVATILWELAKVAFGIYTRALDTFSAYGALALTAGLLTWIYVTALIILLGAEIVKSQRDRAGVR
jgi:membrane protein